MSFLKAAKYQDGHAGYSDPLDEQRFLVDTINALQGSKAWGATAVVIAYDDAEAGTTTSPAQPSPAQPSPAQPSPVRLPPHSHADNVILDPASGARPQR